MSSLPLHPSMNTRHMGIQIFDPTEGLVHPHTARDPAEEGSLPGRIAGAHIALLSHGLVDIVTLLKVGARKSLICLRPVHPMGHLMMLPHTLPTCIMLPSQDTGWISLGCKLVGEPVTCTMKPESCCICCMDTSLHGVPPCASSACGGWVAPSHTQGTPWHPSPLQAAGMALQPPRRLQPPLAGLHLSGERTLAASPS